MKIAPPRSVLLIAALLAALAADAQVPSRLRYGIPAPYGTGQTGGKLGFSVAVDGSYTVAGAMYDSTAGGNSGVVKIFDTASGTELFKLINPIPAVAANFGWSVAISGTRVAVGTPYPLTGAASAATVYIYDLAGATPTVPVFTLHNPGLGANDNFGWSLAISGTRLVVGAPLDDTGATDAGIVYVYDLAGATPTVPTARLNRANPSLNDQFGTSVALTGNRVAVGAPGIAFGGTTGAYAGRAYIFDLGSATPATPTLTLNNPVQAETYGQFGRAVALDGARLVVGAYQDDTAGFNAGSAYLYDLSGATPAVPALTLYNPSPAVDGGFGGAVAILGTRLVVGASDATVGTSGNGSAYVYELAGGTPTVPTLAIHEPNPVLAYGSAFGGSVALSSTRVVIGAGNDPTEALFAGSVFLYDPAGATPTAPVTQLNDPGPSVNDGFGFSTAVAGNLLVIGAPFSYVDGVGQLIDTNRGADIGRVYVFDLGSANPSVPAFTLNKPNPAKGDGFGWWVAISGTRVVVGAPGDSDGAVGTGSAYVYDLSGANPTVPLAMLYDPTPTMNDGFGSIVAISGTRVLVRSGDYFPGSAGIGKVYVYDLASATPAAPVVTLQSLNPTVYTQIGWVALSGSRALVAAFKPTAGAVDGNVVYEFDLDSATPTVPILTLHDPVAAPGSGFGGSLAISGTLLAVAATGDNTGATQAGAVYAFDLGSATPSVPIATLHNPAPLAGDAFGSPLAISGTRLVAGVRHTVGPGTMLAYIYDLSSATPAAPVATLLSPSPISLNGSAAISGATVVLGAPFDNTIAYGKGYAYVFGPNPNDLDNNGLLDSWEMARFGNATGHLATDDDDRDGFINLLKEAFNPDPLGHDTAAAVPAPVNEGGYLTITVTKQPGVTYQVLSAATLDPAAFTSADTTILVNNATALKVRDNFLIGTTPGRFMRVQVTAAP